LAKESSNLTPPVGVAVGTGTGVALALGIFRGIVRGISRGLLGGVGRGILDRAGSDGGDTLVAVLGGSVGNTRGGANSGKRLISAGVNCTNLTVCRSDKGLVVMGNTGCKIQINPCKFTEIIVARAMSNGDVSELERVGSVSNIKLDIKQGGIANFKLQIADLNSIQNPKSKI
jgi:hypothetical protein